MSASDLTYFRDGHEYRLFVQVQDDAGNYVDFTARDPAGAGDYWSGLVQAPTITVKADSGGRVFVASVSDLVFDNSLFGPRAACGFWDQALPVTVHRDIAYTFAQWKNKRVRLGVYVFNADGTYRTTRLLATMRIKDVQRNEQTATVSLVSLHEALIRKSAATVRNGGEWFRNLPVAALLKRLVQASDPSMSVTVDDFVDLGTLDAMRTTSWGACPGMLTDGSVSTYHWIPRVIERDQQDADVLWVGFEVPGPNARSGGGLAKFNVVSGAWTIYRTPVDMDEGWPIALWFPPSGSECYVWLCRECSPAGATKAGFYELLLTQIDRTGSVWQYAGSWRAYWPARWALRRTMIDAVNPINYLLGFTDNLSGGPSTKEYHGESALFPFPQTIDGLGTYYAGATATYNEGGSRIDRVGYTQAGASTDNAITPFFDYTPVAVGAGGVEVTVSAGSLTKEYLRLWMTDSWHAPRVYQQSGVDYSIWISTVPGADTWRINRVRLNNGAADTWSLGLGGTTPLFDRQITAYCLYPSLDGTHRKLLVAATAWEETAQDSLPPLSTSYLYEVTFDGASGTAATVTARVTNNPADAVDPADCVSIVGLWCPYKNGQRGKQTVDYAVGVVLNRGNVSGPCYGLMIYKASTTTDIVRFRKADAQKGPTSQRPFAGFVLDSTDDDVFRFVDQANGQVWRCEVDLTAEDITCTIENGGFPADAETHVATVEGEAITPDSPNDQVRYLWGMSPGPHGDTTQPYWERQSASLLRRLPGLYPLVQLSTKVTHCIPVADFSGDGYNCWKAFADLLQVMPRYRCYPDSDGNLVVTTREAPAGTLPNLVLPSSYPVAAIESGDYPVHGYSKCGLAYGEIVNAVDVVPHALQSAGEPELSTTKSADSTFAGEFIYAANTERPVRVGLICVSGGDLVAGAATDQQSGNLWRWFRVMETLTLFLTVGTGATDTSVQIGGVSIRATDEVFAGEQRIRVGDYVEVQGGTRRSIVSFGAYSESSITLNLSGTVGVATAGYAEVQIIPRDSGAVSDGESGITSLLVLCSSAASSITVRDASQIRVGMVLQIEDATNLRTERMLVTKISGAAISVTRGVFGTVANTSNLAANSVVKAYISTRVPGKLYEVGDTGILFGCDVDPSADAKDRSIASGDMFFIATKGLALRPMEHATIRRLDVTSIADNERQERSVENRFLDPARAEAVAQSIIEMQARARTNISGVSMPFWPSIEAGGSVTTAEERFVPPAVDPDAFEVRSLTHRLGDWMMTLDLASHNAIAGAGARPADAEEAVEGFAVAAGQERRL